MIYLLWICGIVYLLVGVYISMIHYWTKTEYLPFKEWSILEKVVLIVIPVFYGLIFYLSKRRCRC